MSDILLTLVQPRWRAEFVEFTRTGEGSREFLEYLEADPNAKRAADLVFQEQVEELRPFVSQVFSSTAR